MIKELFDHILMAKDWLKDRKNSSSMLAFFATSIYQMSNNGAIGASFKSKANETLKKISYDSSTMAVQQLLNDTFPDFTFEIRNIWKKLPDYQLFKLNENQPSIPIYTLNEVVLNPNPIYKLDKMGIAYDFEVIVRNNSDLFNEQKAMIEAFLQKHTIAGRIFKTKHI